MKENPKMLKPTIVDNIVCDFLTDWLPIASNSADLRHIEVPPILTPPKNARVT